MLLLDNCRFGVLAVSGHSLEFHLQRSLCVGAFAEGSRDCKLRISHHVHFHGKRQLSVLRLFLEELTRRMVSCCVVKNLAQLWLPLRRPSKIWVSAFFSCLQHVTPFNHVTKKKGPGETRPEPGWIHATAARGAVRKTKRL